jgi:two-component system invasion response regulator UvrY
MVNVLVVDDHWVVRDGFERWFMGTPEVRVTDKVETLRQAFRVLQAKGNALDVILLDANLRDESGIEAIPELKKRCSGVRVLVVSMLSPNPHAVRAMEQGADGFVSKGGAPSELLEAVRAVAQGRKHVTQEVGHLLAERLLRHNDLTSRESEIVRFYAKGLRCGEIAAMMSLSPKTVSAHKANAMRKLDIRSNADLIRWSMEHDLA